MEVFNLFEEQKQGVFEDKIVCHYYSFITNKQSN